jgi:LysM repeat protein
MTRLLAIACTMGLLVTAALTARPATAFTGFSPLLHVVPAPDIYAGDTVTVSVTAPAWPAPMSAHVWFRSESDSWQSDAPWDSGCGCFSATHPLASTSHPDESATVIVRLSWGKHPQHQWWLTNHDATASADLQSLVVHGERIVPVPTRPPSTGKGGTSEYVVRPGDTLWGIARSHGIALATLEAANPQIVDPNRIYVGEIIRLWVP